MKKFTKGMLIAAGIFGAAGIGLTIAGGVMGASMADVNGVESIRKILWTEKDVVELGLMDDDMDEEDNVDEADDMNESDDIDGRDVEKTDDAISEGI